MNAASSQPEVLQNRYLGVFVSPEHAVLPGPVHAAIAPLHLCSLRPCLQLQAAMVKARAKQIQKKLQKLRKASEAPHLPWPVAAACCTAAAGVPPPPVADALMQSEQAGGDAVAPTAAGEGPAPPRRVQQKLTKKVKFLQREFT